MNYAATFYLKMIRAFDQGDLETARQLSLRTVRMIQCIKQLGVLPAGKAMMGLRGIDCGPTRPPLAPLTDSATERLIGQMTDLGVIGTEGPNRSGHLASPEDEGVRCANR